MTLAITARLNDNEKCNKYWLWENIKNQFSVCGSAAIRGIETAREHK